MLCSALGSQSGLRHETAPHLERSRIPAEVRDHLETELRASRSEAAARAAAAEEELRRKAELAKQLAEQTALLKNLHVRGATRREG